MTEEIKKIAGEVVSGLQSSPVLLGIVVMNVVGIAAALWFLHTLLQVNAANMQMLLKACLPKG